MGVKLNFEAVNALPNPLEAGTVYFLDHGDGTATQVVTDATGQITGRQVVGLMTSGALGRTGAVTTRLNKNATTLGHKFTNTSGAPIVLSSVTVEGITLSAGSATLYVFNEGGQVLASAPATAQDGGLTSPLAYTIPAGESVLIAVISTGGYLTASLSSGHTWAGLTMADAILYTTISAVQGGMIGEDNGAPTAQLRLQFGVGGQVIRKIEAGEGLTASVQAGTLHLDLAPIDLSATGDGAVSEIMWTQDNRHVSAGEIMRVRSNADQELGSISLYWRATTEHAGAATQARLSLRTLAGAMLIESPWQALPAALTWQPFALPLNLSAGQEVALHTEYDVDVSGNVNFSPIGGYRATANTSPTTTQVATADGAYTTFSPTSTTNSPYAVRFTQPGGLFRGQLPGDRVAGFTEVLGRVTALEARPVWTQEAFEDAVGAMLPQGTYNDETGKISFIFAAPRTDEEIQDIVDALIQAGAHVTKTYDDAGNVLTISASGGGSAGTVTITSPLLTRTTAALYSGGTLATNSLAAYTAPASMTVVSGEAQDATAAYNAGVKMALLSGVTPVDGVAEAVLKQDGLLVWRATSWQSRYAIIHAGTVLYIDGRYNNVGGGQGSIDGIAGPVRVRVEFSGSTHKVFVDGTLRATVTDSVITTAGGVGFALQQPAGRVSEFSYRVSNTATVTGVPAGSTLTVGGSPVTSPFALTAPAVAVVKDAGGVTKAQATVNPGDVWAYSESTQTSAVDMSRAVYDPNNDGKIDVPQLGSGSAPVGFFLVADGAGNVITSAGRLVVSREENADGRRHVEFWGDSFTQGSATYGSVAYEAGKQLAARYGDGGPGRIVLVQDAYLGRGGSLSQSGLTTHWDGSTVNLESPLLGGLSATGGTSGASFTANPGAGSWSRIDLYFVEQGGSFTLNGTNFTTTNTGRVRRVSVTSSAQASVTAIMGANLFFAVDFVGATPGARASNGGVGGTTAEQWARRTEARVQEYLALTGDAPVVVMLGRNDSYLLAYDPRDWRGHLQRVITSAHLAGRTVMAAAQPVASDEGTDRGALQKRYAQMLPSLDTEAAVDFVAEWGAYDAARWTAGGTHPSVTGAADLATRLLSRVK